MPTILPIFFGTLFCAALNCIQIDDELFSLQISEKVQENSKLPFTKYTGSGPMQSYLAMNIRYTPVQKLEMKLEELVTEPLKNRGEAHITVITPVEYDQVLRRKVSIAEINAIAENANIQASRFDINCVGEGKALLGRKTAVTYFVVVNSQDLLNIRRKVAALFYQRGGLVEEFNPNHFYPHITIGYTDQDLHENQGVIKDDTSCRWNLEVVP